MQLPRWARLPAGWRRLAIVNMVLMSVALVIMISISLAAFLVTGDFKQTWIFHTTKCLDISTPNTLVHLLLNALSTIVLASSNFLMQICNAPSRQEIDKTHAKQDWLDIGIPSWRNAFRISWFKFVAWSILFLTSIPIHMIFNSSVILLDNRMGDYRMTIATQGYFEGAAYIPPGASLVNSPPLTTYFNNSDQYQPPGLGNSSLIPDIQPHTDNQSITHAQYLASTATNAQGWKMMDVSACLGMYTEKSCYGLRDYRDVVIIVEGPGWDDPHLWNSSEAPHQISQTATSEKNPVFISTQCRMFGELQDFTPYCRSDCNSIIPNMSPAENNWLFNISNWSQLGELNWFRWKASLYPGGENLLGFVSEHGLEHYNWKLGKSTFKISHCMAEPRISDCSFAVSKPLFLVLIVSIGLKLIVCAIVIWTLGPEESLVTPGDVIASFLSSPNNNKCVRGPMTQMQIRTNRRKVGHQSLSN
ncbi:hypothetical protein CCHR01_06310 [Colletotrichum chrysophilum]|uniref:DUF6536 domain-containing protein n=1 Tax=Colletotrichum chrysophilum TaxID=1836956 RepID=A0AAD9ANY4_9PEZI|nr:hypothetical protein CCHR01_06310 [Colletotrichum chrysophilum]